MPVNQVKTPADEVRWEKAKQQVHKQYPNIKESDSRFWKLVSSVFRSMKDGKGNK